MARVPESSLAAAPRSRAYSYGGWPLPVDSTRARKRAQQVRRTSQGSDSTQSPTTVLGKRSCSLPSCLVPFPEDRDEHRRFSKMIHCALPVAVKISFSGNFQLDLRGFLILLGFERAST
jgi:hypothetical protein